MYSNMTVTNTVPFLSISSQHPTSSHGSWISWPPGSVKHITGACHFHPKRPSTDSKVRPKKGRASAAPITSASGRSARLKRKIHQILEAKGKGTKAGKGVSRA